MREIHLIAARYDSRLLRWQDFSFYFDISAGELKYLGGQMILSMMLCRQSAGRPSDGVSIL